MLTLNDGRSELWQWDTGRTVSVDADCSQVHFSNKVFGRSIDVDVIDGAAIIPDILLQTDKELNVWAFVGTSENGYTKISKTFKVNRRNKPADYVFTPPDQTSLEEIKEKLDYLESIQDPDAIKNAVDDYLANNPIKVEEKDPTVPEWAKQPTPPDVKIPDKLPNPHSITFTGAVNASYDGSDPVEITIPGSGGNVDWLDPEEGEVFTSVVNTPDVPAPTLTGITASYTGGDVLIGTALTALVGIVVTAKYSDGTTKTVTDYTLSGSITEGSNTITVTYEGMTTTFTVTGVAEEPEVTLTSISATYTGGNVAVGTAVTALTGITVTAHYSDGSTATVTGYTLSGTIAEGSNTITVSYGGMTTTFTVTGEAENTDSVEYPVYLETIDGVEYMSTTDRDLVGDFLNSTSYTNDTYTCYGFNPHGHAAYLDRAVAEPYGGVIPFAEGTNNTGYVLLNYAVEGEYCGGPSKGWVRLYNDFGQYENVHDYYWGKYGVLKVALKSGLSKHTVDPSLITSISVQQNDDTWQYAQFNYAHGLGVNVYRGCNTLTFRTGDNLNLSGKNFPCAALHSNGKMSIKFKPGTFTDFTLDAVKAFLTEHPLTFIY